MQIFRITHRSQGHRYENAKKLNQQDATRVRNLNTQRTQGCPQCLDTPRSLYHQKQHLHNHLTLLERLE